MPRNPENTNQHLFNESFYKGLPVMRNMGPFIEEYLEATFRTLDYALAQYPRIFSFRADLRFPQGIDLANCDRSNAVIAAFFESFKAKIKHHQAMVGKRAGFAHGSKVRYIWCREIGEWGRPHYHLLIILNRDAYYTVGRLGSEADNMVSRLEEAWASALGLSREHVSGLVHIPDNAVYRVDRHDRPGKGNQLSELYERVSYLSKAGTKRFGNRLHGFGCSRG